MRTSGIVVPFESAELPLIKVALGWRQLPGDGREPFTSGRWGTGDVCKSQENGWIYFNLPKEVPGAKLTHVTAQVWTGYNTWLRARGHDRSVDHRTLQMSFPEGAISEAEVFLSLRNREIVAHPDNFNASHDFSLPAEELFYDGITWLVEHATEHIEAQPV